MHQLREQIETSSADEQAQDQSFGPDVGPGGGSGDYLTPVAGARLRRIKKRFCGACTYGETPLLP